MENTVFVYHKEGKIKVLDYKTDAYLGEKMVSENWEHTATLNTCVWIEYLFNQADNEDILEGIKELSIKVK